jgi:hypothetical protein
MMLVFPLPSSPDHHPPRYELPKGVAASLKVLYSFLRNTASELSDALENWNFNFKTSAPSALLLTNIEENYSAFIKARFKPAAHTSRGEHINLFLTWSSRRE